MYSPKSGVFAWHKQHFGDQTKVGYKDIIPMFKAEKFNADAWADLFARSGAKFAGRQSAARPAADGSMTLLPETADLHGGQVRTEEQHGHVYIAAWDKPEDWVSWAIAIPAKAAYQVEAVYSAASGDSAFDVVLAGQKLAIRAERTTDWFSYRHAILGKFEIPKAGIYELTIRAHDSATWRPVNIRSIKLARSP